VAGSNIDGIGGLLQRAFQEDDGLRSLLQAMVQQALQVEVQEHLAAGPSQRTIQRRGATTPPFGTVASMPAPSAAKTTTPTASAPTPPASSPIPAISTTSKSS